MKDTVKLWAINIATVITMANVQAIVAVLLGLVTMGYTIHQWIRFARHKKR